MQIPHYSHTKFRSQTAEQRHKTIDKLLSALEASIQDWESVCAIRAEILDHTQDITDPAQLAIVEKLPQVHNAHGLLSILTPYFDAKGIVRKDNQIPIRTRDGSPVPDPEALQRAGQIIVIVDNLRSVFNVGSIFRTAECLALHSIYLCGISPTPEHPNMEKTAMGTSQLVPWQYFADTASAIQAAKAQGYQVYALETATSATSVFDTQLKFPLAIVLGNESLGISADTLSQCDQILDLPVLGWKNSLNVGVAFSVCAYQIVFSKPLSHLL